MMMNHILFYHILTLTFVTALHQPVEPIMNAHLFYLNFIRVELGKQRRRNTPNNYLLNFLSLSPLPHCFACFFIWYIFRLEIVHVYIHSHTHIHITVLFKQVYVFFYLNLIFPNIFLTRSLFFLLFGLDTKLIFVQGKSEYLPIFLLFTPNGLLLVTQNNVCTLLLSFFCNQIISIAQTNKKKLCLIKM